MSQRARLPGVLLVAALLTGACGGGGESGSPAASAPPALGAQDTAPAAEDTAPAAPGTAGDALPAVMVQDVAGGGSVSIRDAVALAKPTLVWFWAPH